ncbi:MAG: tRNA uridine-5-carboxymethylaminomethyl(34) synthesis enzyme MnmG [Bacteroidales bacterium]|jgi:tRNA uridine 5-carboxymethylaminomethyl modification enzyme|nr:tRNA uridine-5-carboxymethylaminomethyl(34) synthesis enzyme MnmG [Bacteroidales bacterium]MDD4213201.1 tRNA uridine-5-carboxymethylaminomethyl(34) synthesis enzyme MnmG [Bacteroidales bacterium]
MSVKQYDIIVVGAGHAGCEAASASANLGSSVLLITMNMNLIAQMSCNPSVGGVAKGQIVREIDALGGKMGIVTDLSMIQFRMLNRSKGSAMWSPRAQCDRMLFSEKWRETLEKTKNLDFRQDEAVDIIIKNNSVCGIITKLGLKIFSRAVILTSGTFLKGIIHVGEKQLYGGRIGENSADKLSDSLHKYGIISNRLKTGTPVRIDGRTVNFNKLEEQRGDEEPGKFSFTNTKFLKKQKSCFLAYTNDEAHRILQTGFDKSPLFKGIIKGRGPRYCPSIEDKIVRFSDKNRHQLFLEPEGWNTIEYYLNGFSSSLPEEIQLNALKKIEGFEKVKIFRPGYAIEYDYFPPDQITATLESKKINNLYFAGQVNGTTGYEEAAAQGLMAGINAHNKLHNKNEFILKRSESYIGVLIDDLVTKTIDEPYRMFTSRAEYRILLRQGNADIRLTNYGYELGLINHNRLNIFKDKEKKINVLYDFIKNESIAPEEINIYLKKIKSPDISQKIKLINLLLRSQVNINFLINYCKKFAEFINEKKIKEKDILEEVEIIVKYESYIKKEKEIANKILKFEEISLKKIFDYNSLISLSAEAREKLNKQKPQNIGQASRISGVSPADINVLILYLGH